MDRPCDQCGTTYQAATARSRYCSDRCRRRANYTGKARRKEAPEASGPIVEVTRSYLHKIDQADSPRGLALLVLAERLDNADRMSDAGLAAVQRQYDATLDRLTLDHRGTITKDDPLVRIAANRARRLAELRKTAAEHHARRAAAQRAG